VLSFLSFVPPHLTLTYKASMRCYTLLALLALLTLSWSQVCEVLPYCYCLRFGVGVGLCLGLLIWSWSHDLV
jgi:hypothetical protein